MADWSVTFFTKVHRYKNLLKRRWWVLAITVGLALTYQAYQLATAPPQYVSNSRMMVDPQIQVANKATYREEYANFYGTQIELMTSGKVKSEAHERVRTRFPEIDPSGVQLDVFQKTNTSIFLFVARGGSPAYVQHYLDAAMESFINLKDEQRESASEKTLTTITEQLIRLDQELEVAEKNLYDFQSENNLNFWKEQNNTAATYLNNLNTELADMNKELSLLDRLSLGENLQRVEERKSSDEETEAILTENTRNPYLETMQAIRGLETQLVQLGEFLTEKHPKIIGLKEEIDRQTKLLEVSEKQGVQQLQSRREVLLVRIDNTKDLIKEWEKKSLEASRLVAQAENLRANVDRLKELRDRLKDVTVNLDVSTSTSQLSLSILESASPPAKVNPGVFKAILIGTMLGLLVGGGILFLLDRIDDRINSFSEFREYFDEEVLGQVPFEDSEPGERVPLLGSHDDRQIYAESFRNIRSSLHYMPTEGERPKTLLVTSAIPGEGKSTVASNLSRALAFTGSKVLLVDGDIRKGVMHDEFETELSPGLADVLEKGVSWRDAIKTTDLKSLDLMPRGRADSHIGELLLSEANTNFLKESKSEYDFVIIDSPPVLAADDTPSIAPKIDGIIMIMRTAFTSSRLTQTSLDQLRQRQANIVGVVVNCINTSLPDYYHYEYYRSYYHAPTEEKSPALSNTQTKPV
jgi:succinoglycan biosynthesis transport protein ExoP